MSEPAAIAIANSDYVHVAWDYGAPIENCAGFAVYRIVKGGDQKGQPLPAFDRDSKGNRVHVTCLDIPFPKYNWRDLFAARGSTVKYRIVPMQGPNQPLAGFTPVETEWVTVAPQCGKASVFFNRGILATQSATDKLWDPAHRKPAFAKIEKKINDPDDELRKSLCGKLYEALTTLLDRAAKEGGSCWASLYELTDGELIDRLAACEDLHLILSNDNQETTVDGKKTTIYDGLNQPAVKKLKKTAQELFRRYMPQGQIGHNKFMVWVDASGKPRAVLTGSTNWTASGLCTQSNNAIVIEDGNLAKQYLEYWHALRADAEEVGIPKKPAPMKGIQGSTLRKSDAIKRKTLPLNAGSTVTVWFSPNTPAILRSGAKTAPPTPIDLDEVYKLIDGAQQSVLFLAFQPGAAGSAGSHHFLQQVAKTAAAKPYLFVRGAVSDPGLTKEFDLTMLKSKPNEDAMIASPQGIFKDFAAWRSEIYKYGHAIIHDKTIVIDPFGPKCAVITGSHNLGFRASSNNDENMLIIRGDRDIAKAYAAHVMDIFEHYRSRWIAANHKDNDYDPRKDANWQERYFQNWKPAYAERLFWVSGGKRLPALAPNPKLKYAAARMEKEAKAKAAAAASKRRK